MFKRSFCFLFIGLMSCSIFAEEQLWGCGYYKLGDDKGFDFTPCWLVSAGVGLSSFSPDDDGSSWSLSDDNDTGFRLSVTYQAFKHIFFEAVYADLGEATFENSNALITSEEAISYQAPALFIGSDYPLVWIPKVDIYAKLGMAAVTNDASSELLPVEETSSSQLAWGIGARYRLSKKWQLRSDFESFSEDSSLLSLSVSYVFGGKPYQYQKAEPKAVAIVAPVVVVSDADDDGVVDERDHCVTREEHKHKVNDIGCVTYTGKFIPAHYPTGKFAVDIDSDIVKNYIKILKGHPDSQLLIHGHTDSVGSEVSNQTLSEQRAQSMMRHLITQGVEASRITIKGFGEKSPIASNSTRSGRDKNRRVELFIQQPSTDDSPRLD